LIKPKGNEGEMILVLQCLADGLTDFEQEYRFDVKRKYRLDLAFPKQKVGIEINGGIWHGKAHSSPLMILRDMEKGNLLILSGWRVLRYTPAQVKDGTAIWGLKALLCAG
jgi:very-short-patch-repair endonuclease